MATKAPPSKQAPVKGAPTKTAPTKSAPSKSAPAKSAKPAAPVASTGPAEKFALKDLQAAVAAHMPMVARATVDRIVEATFTEMTAAYTAGKSVNIKDFGRLEIKHRPARTGRNPSTGDTIEIAAKSVPKFTFAKALKEAV